jgi:hypothetical protein
MRRAAIALLSFLAVMACGTSSTDSSPSGDGGPTNDGGSGTATCEVTRAFVTRCKGELNCGADKFDAWCAANDQKVNSEAYRRAEAKCLPNVPCDATVRSACEYMSFGSETPTAAQKALVEAYCATCEPADPQGCATASTTYNEAAGPGVVKDIFIAAWELADPIVDQVREKCTGAALPAGTEPCATRFGSCASGPYLDAVPNCD